VEAETALPLSIPGIFTAMQPSITIFMDYWDVPADGRVQNLPSADSTP
jgi:hypothetical protein